MKIDWRNKRFIAELIKEQKLTNKLLEKTIKLQVHFINNECEVHSRKEKVKSYFGEP